MQNNVFLALYNQLWAIHNQLCKF